MLCLLVASALPVRADARAPETEPGFDPVSPSPRPAGDWLRDYRMLAAAAPVHCSTPDIPSLDRHAPARAFILEPRAAQSQSQPLIATIKDPIVERFIVLAEAADGCIRVHESGRSLPFEQRSLSSPFPNARLPAALGETPAVAIVIDHQSVRPWIELIPEARFQCLSEQLWIAISMFTGMLATLFVIALLVTRYQRSRLTLAYLAYLIALQFYQLQALGLGPAWLPFWPPPSAHHLLQAFAAGTAVIGLSLLAITFLRPGGWMRSVLIASVALSAGGFYLAAFNAGAYRFGAAILPLLAILVIVLLARRLREGEPAMRWFAVGLAAALGGGGIQAAAVVTQGAWLPPMAAFAFPLGNVIESICWLIAILMRLRATNLSLQHRLIHEAQHDPLTGLRSRASMHAHLVNAIAAAKSSPHPTPGLIFIDLGGFRRINDRFGQARGDQVLCCFSTMLRELGLEAEAIGRFGGDEFMVLMRRDAHWSHTEGAAATILARFREPIRIDDDSVLIRPDIGLLRITADYDSVDEVLQDADRALQVSKQFGGRRATPFESRMREDAKAQEALKRALEEAIRTHQLDLHYQPIVTFESMTPVGFEALLRWQRPGQKSIAVEQVFVVAESAGLLGALGERIIELALAQIADWQRRGVWSPGLFLSINACEQQLIDGRFLDDLHGALQTHGVDACALRLELSERSLGTDLDWSRLVLPRLLNQHILLGVDNFGAGLASLTMLTDLQPDFIKVDRSLVAALPNLPRAQHLARIGCLLAEQIGSLAVAEGIETQGQLDTLREFGFEHGQGRLIAAPMSGAETAGWLQLAARAHDQPLTENSWQMKLH
ncbi:putative bifunctional diguanylate cyclase/phosphodiesterase [Halochromatium sp.]|uniref:putative bifunctional diguanylate cyclase/phosphodiesterase n=1 Tax=Halochromatium sp. TaxID=2049430 RepID=UPI00397A6D77